jgi:hypothetical protein
MKIVTQVVGYEQKHHGNGYHHYIGSTHLAPPNESIPVLGVPV